MEKINDSVFAKKVPDFLPVDVWLAGAGAAVRGDDKDFGLRLAMLHQLDPVPYETLLRTFPRLPYDQIHRRGAEEELVRGPVDPLPAEIPAVQRDFRAGDGIGHLYWLGLNSVRAV